MKDDFQKAISQKNYQKTINLLERGLNSVYEHPKLGDGVVIVLEGLTLGKFSEGKVCSVLRELDRNKVPYKETVSSLESYSLIRDQLPRSIQNGLKWRNF
ncbi:MAG: hypothetical protein PHH88_02470 [Candidatus Pacebacteria bacterium]|nr:hypothetical protein [Candidatus Paceibacterota bacterium]